MRVGLACLAFTLVSCGPELDRRPTGKPSDYETIGAVSAPVFRQTEARRLPVEPGQSYLLVLGNRTHKVQLTQIDGAQPDAIQLQPGWQRVVVQAVSSELRMPLTDDIALGSVVAYASFETPNIALISIDTLRADHFSSAKMPLTYRLFKDRGAIWTAAYTTAPWTLPAHASLLSGLYPAAHGVRTPQDALSTQVYTLAQALSDVGYFTLSVNEGNYLSATFRLNRGFDWYAEHPPQLMSDDPQLASVMAANLKRLSRHIDDLPQVPIFAFFHTYEVHCPYFARGDLTDLEGHGQTQWLLDHDGEALSQETYDHLKALYSGEVAYVDRILAPWIEERLDQGWLVVLVSDHGDEFGEHGGLLHADTLYEEAMRVPLAMAGPGVAAGIYPQRASILDVAPSLLTLIGQAPSATWQGRPLPAESETTLFGESYFWGPHKPTDGARLVGVWLGSQKLIQARNRNVFEVQLFDLQLDPLERADLSSSQGARCDQLFRWVQLYLDQQRMDAEQIGALSEEQLELMRSLGYVE